MITAPGPLNTPVAIMIVVQQINEGVKYDYSLPITSNEIPQIAPPLVKQSPVVEPSNLEPRRLNIPLNSNTQKDEPKISAPHRRRARRRFIWKHAGFSPCTKSCGGGVQTSTFICMREHNQMAVSERRCSGLEKPAIQQVRCNIHSCPPQWKSSWATCTGSCGQGIQQLIHRCEQEIAPGKSTIVNEVGCPQPKPLSETKQCTLPPCSDTFDNELQPNISPRLGNDLQEWAVGIWSQCSATCGSGHKTRAVTCPSGRCNPEHRPPHVERCQTSPCPPDSNTRSSWLTSEWSECSTLCGTGTQTRQSFCFQTSCENDLKPEETRACSTYKLCNGQWFTGPWGPCSDSCNGPARQRRDVHCIIKIRGQPHVTNDITCNQSEKPYEEQACYGTCSPKWFSSDWGVCEGGCSNGVHRRDVRCLDNQGRHATTCKVDEMPPVKKPCTCKTSEDPSIHILPQDEPVDNSCVDKLQICTAAMQARLCQYPYYINNCCRSCKKFKQDGL
ncbi:ADAMTS-like protein 4 [Agrilus planipennis]|uniref:ADAMTS-like protein 4 n=1 Tax=Agrilus planipennis TaxID=224129 RepID=A0A7F5RBT6_AGRPL|nr:ADAMTS-like protein 4 [Agrilus planipennis]